MTWLKPAETLLALLAGGALFLMPVPAHADTQAGLDDMRAGRYAEAISEWKAAAGSGDATAALFLGVMADTGQGLPQDYAQALAWYRRAADGGSPSGMFNVGIMYDAGQGVRQDQAEAARWYRRAADRGFARAEYNLGLMYEDGSGVAPDRQQAIRLFRSAAQHGLTAAESHLVHLGLSRPSLPRRQTAPVADADDTAMAKFRRAQAGMMARTPSDARNAIALFRQAAQRRDPVAQYAQYDLGYCYENGIGVPSDKAQAYGWYLRSSTSGADDGLKSIAASGARNLEAQLSPTQREQARSQAGVAH